MDKETIGIAIADAIVAVAQEEWGRLAGEFLDTSGYLYAARSIEKSLRSLQSLQTGGSPTYNEWDTLLYGTWFQPKQINLIYSTLNALRKRWTIDGQPWWDGDIFEVADGDLHVIDFGCGALATQFAITMAASDSVGRGIKVSNIRLDSIDPSLPMIYFGQRVWDRFVELMRIRHPQDPICSIFGSVHASSHVSLDTVPDSSDTTCYLTAIHVAYDSEVEEVKASLLDLKSRFGPTGVMMTTHSGKRGILDRMSPVRGDSKYIRIPTDKISVPPVFSGRLDRVTEWRRILSNRLLSKRGLLANSGVDIDFVRNYLANDVDWAYSSSAHHVHMSRELGLNDDDDLPW